MTLYRYLARPDRIVDGDTIVLDMDLGLHVHHFSACRLAGINAPEMNTAEGLISKNWLAHRMDGIALLYVHSEKLDKYGRPLVWLWPPTTPEPNKLNSINCEMVNAGRAVAMP